MQSKKDYSVETLRGIAIILLVTHHVIGRSSSGLALPPDSFLRYIDESLEFLRLPLFTVISGYIYAISPLKQGTQYIFMQRKVRRLLYPLITVGGLTYIFQAFTPGTNNPPDISKIYIILTASYIHFWYLRALLLLFLVVVLLELNHFIRKIQYWIILVFICLLISGILHETYIGSYFNDFIPIKQCFYLLPFFLLGLGIKRFDIITNQWLIYLSFVGLLTGLIIQQMHFSGYISYYTWANPISRSILGSITGMFGNIIFFKYRKNVKILAWVGGYAFTIYLFHMFGVGGSRIALRILGLNFISLQLIFGVIFSVLLCVLIDIILNKFNLSRVYILGNPKIRK
jgi:peptidoglycan/LPS O-acetylase OafA/YrhL